MWSEKSIENKYDEREKEGRQVQGACRVTWHHLIVQEQNIAAQDTPTRR